MSYKKKYLMIASPLDETLPALKAFDGCIDISTDHESYLVGKASDAHHVNTYGFDESVDINLGAFLNFALGCPQFTKDIAICYVEVEHYTEGLEVTRVDFRRVRCGLLATYMSDSKEEDFEEYLGFTIDEDTFFDRVKFFSGFSKDVITAAFAVLFTTIYPSVDETTEE